MSLIPSGELKANLSLAITGAVPGVSMSLIPSGELKAIGPVVPVL